MYCLNVRCQGAINQVPANATAFAQRSLLYNLQYFVSWDKAADEQNSVAWIRQLQQTLTPYMAPQAYVNYIDSELAGWPAAYYGPALGRLQALKQTLDPSNFFQNPQTIPLPS